jgi:hypothetical protein
MPVGEARVMLATDYILNEQGGFSARWVLGQQFWWAEKPKVT